MRLFCPLGYLQQPGKRRLPVSERLGCVFSEDAQVGVREGSNPLEILLRRPQGVGQRPGTLGLGRAPPTASLALWIIAANGILVFMPRGILPRV
jgi:hypothetical protein